MWRLIIVVLFAVVTCRNISPTEEPLPSCKDHDPNAFFVDPKNASIFYRCDHGKCVGRFHCQDGLIFSEERQVCVRDVGQKCLHPNGTFAYPGNPHKYIECYENVPFIRTCASDLVFDEEKHECVYNEHGLTWPTDPTIPPTTPQPTTGVPVQTTGPPVQTTGAPVQTTGASVQTTGAPVQTTGAPVQTTEAPVDTTKTL